MHWPELQWLSLEHIAPFGRGDSQVPLMHSRELHWLLDVQL